MTTKDEALNLALEALENAWLDASMGKGDVARHTEAITAIREALAEQPEQQQYQSTADKCELTPVPAKGGLLPEQPQQEPVAYRSCLESGSYTYCNTAQFFDNAEPLYTSPPARKPLTDGEKSLLWAKMFGPNALPHNRPYYCHLTRDGFDIVTKFIEAAHGIKENT